ncbi:hypothetical protein CRYUN_Cryun28dG0015600 [Craigia yunnanensis]
MLFGITYHSFTINVGQNGAYTTRGFANSLTLAPGQTHVLLSANQNLGDYYMTARPSSSRHNTTGIVQYSTIGF